MRTLEVVAGNAAAGELIVVSVPPAAAVDVYVRYRDPVTGSSVNPNLGNAQWRLYAVQRTFSALLDQLNEGEFETNGRAFAIRDYPADSYEVRINKATIGPGLTCFYDVIVIGWAREPTGMGPFAISTIIGGRAAPNRLVSIPLMAYNGTLNVFGALWMNGRGQNIANPGLNTLPSGIFHTVPPTLANNDTNTLEMDAAGNLKVTLAGGGGVATFPAATAIADDEATPTTTRVGANTLFFDGATWDRARSGIITAGTPTGWQNVLGGGVFNTAAPTLSNGQAVTLQMTAAGVLKTIDQNTSQDTANGVVATQVLPVAVSAPYTYSRDIDFGTVTKKNVKAGSGNVYALDAQNDNATGRYFQIHNKATAPAATDVPIYSFWVPPNSTLEKGMNDFFGPAGINFATGIGWAWSTTKATFTDAATAADHTTHLHFK